MELQESSVRNAHTFIGFPRTPTFLDVRGHLVRQLREALSLDDWLTDEDPPRLIVRSDAPAMFVGVDDDSSIFGADDPVDLDAMQQRATTGQALVLDTLGVSEASYVGAGATAVAPAESFEGLASWLADRLGPEPRFRGTFGDNPSNAWWRLEWDHAEKGFAVDVGPMSSDAPAAETNFLNLDTLELPPAFLFIDVRRSVGSAESTISAADAIGACSDVLADAWAALQRFDDELRKPL